MLERMTWAELNAWLMEEHRTEAEVQRAMRDELGAKNPRLTYVYRMKSRLNRIRLRRERVELTKRMGR